jgi:hypothetical protein
VRDALIEAGAPVGDVAAIEQLFAQPTGAGGEVSRFAIVRDGQVEVDELLPGRPIADKVTSYGPVPNLAPLRKVNAGGWSQGRYQRDAEQIRKRNEKELAEAIDEIVRDNAVELLVVSGEHDALERLATEIGHGGGLAAAGVGAATLRWPPRLTVPGA